MYTAAGSTAPVNMTKGVHPVGFNDHTDYDPFFPSSPSDERLMPVANNLLANPQSYYTSSSPANSNLIDQVPRSQFHRNPTSSPPNTYNQPYQQPPIPSNADSLYPSYIAQSHEDYQNVGTPNNLLSPHAPYLSDTGYTEPSDHSVTPEVDDEFYLETNYGLLDPDYELSSGRSPEQVGALPPGSISIGSYDNRGSEHKNWASSGKATLSSHLMSPMLTDTASPGSRDERTSPTINGFSNEVSSAFFGQPRYPGYSGTSSNQMQYGLGLQSGPNDSGVGPAVSNSFPVPSPRVLVENYSRGDSPSRAVGPSFRHGLKRSPGSQSPTHLAVQDDGNSSDDDDDSSRQDSQGTAVPISTHAGSDEGEAESVNGRGGLDPEARVKLSGNGVPNFKDQERTAEVQLKKADVEDWLSRSAVGPEGRVADPNKSKPTKPTAHKPRLRALSAGDHSLSHANIRGLKPSRPDAHIPGPGLLLDIESGDEDDEDDEGYDTGDEKGLPDLPAPPDIVQSPEALDEAVNQAPADRMRVWQDSLLDSYDPESKIQPVTSNDAMMRFKQRAEDFETVSLAATWGTRRLSDGGLEGLFHDLSFKQVSQDKEKDEKRRGFFEQVGAKLLSRRRDGSNLKRNQSDNSKQEDVRPAVVESEKKNSFGSRHESEGHAVSPSMMQNSWPARIDTNGAAATFQQNNASANGPGNGAGNGTMASPSSPWASAKNVMKRSRSRSDMQRPTSPSQSKIAELWTKQGGPPMPTLATPHQESEMPAHSALPADLEDEDEDEVLEDRGVTMDLTIRLDPIVPTLEGFRSNVSQLNPRLPKFLIDRIAQEQLRRYKKLVDFKVKHSQAIKARKCDSRKHCIELGGEPTYLPSKASTKEPELSHTGFSISGLGGSDDDSSALADGVVTAAQFPPGVPMPPVKRLPAEFECSLCFKVKKFHKPSDWSKHVHEDVQPFTCTFEHCADPKSFKRKADWVRHENERHRQLEWWTCNYRDCTHKCYRKDNFVQHLVREHKLPEPKVKVAKPGKPAVRGPSAQKARTKAQDKEDANDGVDIVWRLVDECRYETTKNPKDETCKFCGNICNSWKKLTVHLAKHMEQISMPVLNVINQQNISSDTIISPIENHICNTTTMSPTTASPRPTGHGNSNAVNSSPSSYPPLQSEQSYFNQSNQSSTSVHRSASASSTYALPNYQPVGWGPVRGNPYANASIPGFKYEELQSPSQFRDPSNNTNKSNTFTRSPKNILTKFRSPSQSTTTGPLYALPGDASHYPSTYTAQTQQPQPTFPAVAEAQPLFSYRANPPPTSYPTQQQPLASATAMGFGPGTPEMGYSPSASNMGNLYMPPRGPGQQQGGYNYMHQ